MTGEGLETVEAGKIVEDLPRPEDSVAEAEVLQEKAGAVTLVEEILEEVVVEVPRITMVPHQQLRKLTLFR